jgi:hypothetical protein
MSLFPKHLIRYSLALLGTVVAAGCSSEGDGGTGTGSITLVLLPTSASIQQGGSAAVAGTLTRSGGFTGTVNLAVTGAPTGVTAVVSNVVTTGLVTTATITINVAASATVGGPTTLTVHGTGSGVTEATATFALTITAAPAPAYTLGLSASTLSIVQGGSTPTTTVNLVRTNFAGNVGLTVENLPTGVTAAFSPVSPISGNSSVLTLTVAAAAPTGTFTNLLVRGTASGLADRTAPLTLTITPAGSFTLAVTPAGGVTLAQGTNDNSKTITITRNNYAANITLTAEGLPAGVTAAFAGNPVGGNTSVLTLTAAAGATVGGPVTVTIRGTGPAAIRAPGGDAVDVEATTTLQVTVTAAVVGNFSLTTTPATNFSLAQGASGDVTVNIARTGGFTGSVNLTVTGLVTGLTASFAPASAPGATSTLTLTAAGSLGLGTYPIVIRGNFTGLGEQTVNLNVNVIVAGNFSLTTTPATSVSITQGASTPTVTVNIVRTGGNTSNVALTATGTLGAGMSLAFLPSSTTTNSSVLTITTTGATPVAPYPIVIRGNTAGLAEQTVNLTVNVTAPGGSGNASVSFVGCTAENKAVWFAFMDGTAGTWTPVTGVGDVYQFNITQSKGSFAYVTLGTGSSTIFVQHMTQAELTAGVFNFCATTPGTRIANGTVSNLPGGALGSISFARSFTSAFANGAFQIQNAQNGSFDLIAYASQVSIGIADRVFVKRGENPSNGGSFSVPVNFTDATLSAQPAAATATLTGLVGGETTLNHGMTFYTQGSACVPATLYSAGTVAASFNMYGVPASLRLGTDMHSINITVLNGSTSFRLLTENFLDIGVRAATPFVLPAQLPVPVATDAGGPYKRPSIAVTGVPAELNLSHSMTYNDQTVTGKTGVVTATQGWVGGSNVTLVLPNFAGVGTFSNAWAPATLDTVNWTFSSAGGTFTGVCTAGQRFVSATRTGTL